jgi:hypothetical protein
VPVEEPSTASTADNWHQQIGDTHFVAHSEQAGAGPFLHATTCRRRGSRTVNSVNAPISLSTVIVRLFSAFILARDPKVLARHHKTCLPALIKSVATICRC